VATYKLIQDIEAEDKVLGPLTLRQFIFALIALFLFYMCYLVTMKGIAFLLVIFLPPALFFGFFALPIGRDQPTEVWALAKLRFLFKPRVRTWNQSGVKELVTVTAPKRIEPVRTKGLSQTEVKSRLETLAATIDSRGWAVKNVDAFAPRLAMAGAGSGSDRLLDFGNLPQEVPNDYMPANNDIMDSDNSPIAQQFDTMINKSEHDHRQELINKMNAPGPSQPASGANDNWFLMTQHGPAPSMPATSGPSNVSAGTDEETALSNELRERSASSPTPYGNLRSLQPLSEQSGEVEASASPATPPPQPVTPPSDPAILYLANNDDLSVETLGREARRAKHQEPPDEVVISLH
jgi:hypothetical protein